MKSFILRELENSESFDPCSIIDRVPFTQAEFYGDWQRNLGRTVRRFQIIDAGKIVAFFQVVKYLLMFGKSYLYVPYGPVVVQGLPLYKENILQFIKQQIKIISNQENAVFVRLDFTPTIPNDVLSKYFTKAPTYTYHSAYFQPRSEWFLDITKSENELLAAMHKNTRYSILTADKREIISEIITADFEKYFDDFYELMLETSKRNKFGLHPKEYYQSVFKSVPSIGGYLSIARFSQKILAIDLVIMYGGTANYVFSGSSTEERNRMPAYSAIWRAIRYAKEKGCEYFNFGGISIDSNTHKAWNGLTSFKKKFGGFEMKHSDFYDIVTAPFWYHVYIMRKWLKKLHS